MPRVGVGAISGLDGILVDWRYRAADLVEPSMTWSELLAHPLFIAIAPALTTGLLGWLALRYRTTQLEKSLEVKSREIERGRQRIAELERTGRDAAALDTRARAARSALVSRLNDLLAHARASRSTLYLPVEDAEGDFLGLLILCTAPIDLADSSFHGTIFAGRDAFAVRSFLDREIVTSEDSVFRFDGFSPSETYADCVFDQGRDNAARVVAVVQVLFGKGHALDAELCKAAVARVSPGIVEDLRFFATDTREKLALIDLVIPEQSKRGVVMFFDVSQSSSLFTNEARVTTTMTMMKRFMEIGVKTVVAQGGVIEGFTGDGFVASFTVNPASAETTVFERALAASRNLLGDSQEALKDLRPELAEDFDVIRPRVGIATGVVHGISFAFGQMRVASVIGRSASNASIVCDSAPRDRACIAIDSATLLELPVQERGNFVEIPREQIAPKGRDRKLAIFVSRALEGA